MSSNPLLPSLAKMASIIKALKIILGDRVYSAVFIIIAAAVFVILFQIQVKTIPGNDVLFQAQIFGPKDWLLLASIAVLNSLFITTQIHIYRLRKTRRGTLANMGSGLTTGSLGTSSGILASVFGTATCSLCVGAIFGFLGSNTVLFLVNHRDLITVATIGLLLLSLRITVKRFNTACQACKIE